MSAAPNELTEPVEAATEALILGTCMITPGALEAAGAAGLAGAHFTLVKHQLIYDTLVELAADGEPCDPTAATRALVRRGRIGKVGRTTVADLVALAGRAAIDVTYHARALRQAATDRETLKALVRGTQMLQGGTGEAGEALATTLAALEALAADRPDGPTLHLVADLSPAALDAMEHAPVRGIATGLADLDAAYPGAMPGDLAIVAGRPGMGKTMLGLGWARHAAITAGQPALFVTMEMSKEQIMQRLFAAEAKVPLRHIIDATLTEDDWRRIADAATRVVGAPLVIVEAAGMSVAALRALMRAMRRRHGLALVVLDQLDKMRPARPRSERRTELAEIAIDLKLAAKDEQVPLVVLHQMNREAPGRADHTPQLTDLKDSGAVEENADTVIMIHREDYYEPTSPRAGEADLLIRKQRQGERTTATTAWQGHYARFVDMAPAPHLA